MLNFYQKIKRNTSLTKYIDDSKINFRFIDSFRFLRSLLDKLALYLEKYPIVDYGFKHYTGEQLKLLKKKGVYPYDFTSSFESRDVTQLPTAEEFYIDLYETNIDENNYKHAKKVWDAFKVENLGEYSDLYLKTDVLLLAYLKIDNCMKLYGLDPAHFFTTLGFSWEAALKYTNIWLDLLTDINMLNFIERGNNFHKSYFRRKKVFTF